MGKSELQSPHGSYAAVFCCRQSDYRKVEAMLRADSYEIITLHGSAIHDRASFFGQAAIDLPQPESQIADCSYDELRENIREMLLIGESRKVAILWSNAHVLIESSIQDYSDILSLFVTLRKELASADSYPWVAVELTVVAFGNGNNFNGRGLECK